jgi:hypothetical protein
MKQDEKYTLKNAIRQFYFTEPLKKDLATLVANKVFNKQEKFSFNWDKLLHYLICIVCIGAVAYILSFLKFVSIAPILLLSITVLIVIGVAVKEFRVLSEKILAIK